MKANHLPFLFLSFLLFACSYGYAQEFPLKGVIFEKGTKIRIALAEVTNKRTKVTVGSNDLGFFQIKTIPGDTLLFKKRNFLNQAIVIYGTSDVIVNLIRETNELSEVTIVGQTRKQELDEIQREFKRQGSFYAGKPPLALLNPFGGAPLTFFYELFGKTPRRARRFNKYYNAEIKQLQIDQYFNKTLISNNTHLKGEELNKFMLDYSPNYEKVQKWTNYDAVKYIKESAKNYTDTLKKPAKI
ncbi:hypothetical protein [Pedobacter nototheniae]|uniref:hypothetical protein n=1 Tax=Pedobacter nototheniae TaxID=2488994 RepID=UPI001038DA5A|nr:hypothetical protein [Pedobacter nototheniae]